MSSKAKMPTIVGDRWDGTSNVEWRIEGASSDDFNRALNQLDGQTYTMLTIQGLGEGHMGIGGGGGRYVVYLTYDNDEFWNLVGSGPADAVVVLKAGGQEGEYAGNQIVDLNQARAAGLVFLRDLGRDPAQRWERQ